VPDDARERVALASLQAERGANFELRFGGRVVLGAGCVGLAEVAYYAHRERH
jgi:hypothetical protein